MSTFYKVIFFIFYFTPVNVFANTLFDMEDAIERTIKRDHRFSAAQSQIDAAESEVKNARRGYYPNLQASAGSGDSFSSNSYEVRATQMLYDWGKVKERVNTRKAEAEIQVYRAKLIKMEAVINVTDVYMNISLNREYLKIYQSFYKNISEIHKLAEARFNSRYSDSIEVDRTSMELARIDQALALYQGKVDIATEDFYEITGLSVVNIELQSPSFLSLFQYTNQSSNEVKNLIINSPEYQISLAESRVARSDFALKEAERMPKINLEASVVRREVGGQWQSDSSIGVQVRYDGFDNWFKPKAARSQLKAAEYNAKATYRDLNRTVRSIHIKEPAIHGRITALKQQATLATKVKNNYYEQFIAGTRDLEDLLSIEREFFEAQRQVIELKKELLIEQYVFAAKLGILTELLSYIGEK
jgi:adhesin transport system outer membrane protein